MTRLTGDYRYHRYRGRVITPYDAQSSAERVASKWRRAYRAVGWAVFTVPCGSHWHVVSRRRIEQEKHTRRLKYGARARTIVLTDAGRAALAGSTDEGERREH